MCFEAAIVEGSVEDSFIPQMRSSVRKVVEQSNECVEYTCDNETGLNSTTICNSSDGTERQCADGRCIISPSDFSPSSSSVESLSISETTESSSSSSSRPAMSPSSSTDPAVVVESSSSSSERSSTMGSPSSTRPAVVGSSNDQSSSQPSPNPVKASSNPGDDSTGLIIGLVCGVALAAVISVLFVVFLVFRKKKERGMKRVDSGSIEFGGDIELESKPKKDTDQPVLFETIVVPLKPEEEDESTAPQGTKAHHSPELGESTMLPYDPTQHSSAGKEECAQTGSDREVNCEDDNEINDKSNESDDDSVDEDDSEETDSENSESAELVPFKLSAFDSSTTDKWSAHLPGMKHYEWNKSPVCAIPLSRRNESKAEEFLSNHNGKDIVEYGASLLKDEPPMLCFGKRGSQVPVNQEIEQKVIFAARDYPRRLSFRIIKRSYPKYEICATPAKGTLTKGKSAVEVTLALKMYCTTSVKLQIPVVFWQETLMRIFCCILWRQHQQIFSSALRS